MEYAFVFRHVDPSDSLKDYATGKLDRTLEKLGHNPVRVQVNFDRRGTQSLVQCQYQGGNGFNIRAAQRAGDPYEGVDLLMDKLTRQLRKKKEMKKLHRG